MKLGKPLRFRKTEETGRPRPMLPLLRSRRRRLYFCAMPADLSSLLRIRVLLGKCEIIAKFDTLYLMNFNNESVLTEAELGSCTLPPPTHYLPLRRATIKLGGTVQLRTTLQEVDYPCTFYVCPELSAELILGRLRLKQHKVICDHVTAFS